MFVHPVTAVKFETQNVMDIVIDGRPLVRRKKLPERDSSRNLISGSRRELDRHCRLKGNKGILTCRVYLRPKYAVYVLDNDFVTCTVVKR